MDKNIIISNSRDFEKKKKIFKEQGVNKIHIISDFDRTLTKSFTNGKCISSMSQLYHGDYLGSNYNKKAKDLFDKYYPIEINPDIPLVEKRKIMKKWWKEHELLLIEYGLNLKHIKKLVSEGNLEFRVGSKEFFDLTHERKIPLIIFSSSGVGDSISFYFDKIKKNYDNIHIISNSFNYDKRGYAISFKEPIIHLLNKGEIALKGLPIIKKLKDKKNVILLGDNLGDLDMVEGFKYDNIIKIGFLNQYDENQLKHYKENFDVVILNDLDMFFVNNLVREF